MHGKLALRTRIGRLNLAWARIWLTYLWRHGRRPDLRSPTLFTELVQRRKLSNRDPRMSDLADKVRVKDFVVKRLGNQWVTPTLWHGDALPAEPCWPTPFVVKSRHGCNQRAFVRSDMEDWPKLRRRAARWMAAPYGRWLDEWAYGKIPRGIMVEAFIGSAGQLPIDWKLFVFEESVRFVQVHLEREHNHRWIVMDRGWQRASAHSDEPDPERPHTLDAMMKAAATLGHGFDFVRIDFYEVEGKPRFGEMTFYPGSGLDRFDPVSLDARMGREWLQAVSASEQPIDPLPISQATPEPHRAVAVSR